MIIKKLANGQLYKVLCRKNRKVVGMMGKKYAHAHLFLVSFPLASQHVPVYLCSGKAKCWRVVNVLFLKVDFDNVQNSCIEQS